MGWVRVMCDLPALNLIEDGFHHEGIMGYTTRVPTVMGIHLLFSLLGVAGVG